MGITLSFKPVPPVSPETADLITAESKTLRSFKEWWSEPPLFTEVSGYGFLGMQKVSLPGFSTGRGGYVEVDPGADLLMMWRDISRIAHYLADWSERFKIGWKLDLEGESFGSIGEKGNFAEDLSSSLQELLQMSGAPSEVIARNELIKTIDTRYMSRWE